MKIIRRLTGCYKSQCPKKMHAPCWFGIKPNFDPGVTINGFFLSEIGLGESARQIYSALETQDGNFFAVNRIMEGAQNDMRFSSICGVDENTSVTITIDGLLGFKKNSSEICRRRYNMALCFWELEKYPQKYIDYLEKFDRILAPSQFIFESLCKYPSLRVSQIKHPVVTPAQAPNFQLSQGVLKVLFFFDYGSFLSRKNPEAAILSFISAFPKKIKDVRLTIKCRGTDSDTSRAWLRGLISRDARISIIDETLTKQEMSDLISSHDVFLSLHRSEGLGLGCAEALAHGKIVVATNYGGITDFITEDTGFPVEWKRISVREDEYVLSTGATWADPDIAHAAVQLRKIYDDPSTAMAKSQKGYENIVKNHSLEKTGAALMRIIDARDD
ncbi:MAG: glycosyltransferase family 4 protein [Sulfitobacter sp.]